MPSWTFKVIRIADMLVTCGNSVCISRLKVVLKRSQVSSLYAHPLPLPFSFYSPLPPLELDPLKFS